LGGPTRFSYAFMVLLLVLTIAVHLATPLLAALFSYLVLTMLVFPRRGGKWIAAGIFIVLIGAAAYGLGYYAKHTIKALPEIADRSIPSVFSWAQQHGIELPFTDYDSLKDLALDSVKVEARYLSGFARFARGATTNILFLVAGCVVAVSLFLNPRFELGRDASGPNQNLYSECCSEIALRFRTLYDSFKTVMGAQIIISAINTVLTGIFVLFLGFPYAIVIVGATFICGLLPVVGNIISNTVVVMVGFTISPRTAFFALLFLVIIHKLEYFLNSKIVGWRIRNPLWLTLLGLIVGERLMGVPGMILAPVILNYIKRETAVFRADRDSDKESEPAVAGA
ncbi:MAG TPA: AI-2E family transporter, partial [Verrucomicrobiae bacterium]